MFRARVVPLRAEVDPDGNLVLVAPTAFDRTWLDRVLRPRLEGILAELGAREARLLLAVAEDRPTGIAPPCD